MVVKNSLKSESIESLSYKLSKIDTNVLNSFRSKTLFRYKISIFFKPKTKI